MMPRHLGFLGVLMPEPGTLDVHGPNESNVELLPESTCWFLKNVRPLCGRWPWVKS